MVEDGRFLWNSPSGKVWDIFINLLTAPHLLVAGETGYGKSVAIHGLISTLLYRFPGNATKECAEMILIDPKAVEFFDYADLPHTLKHVDGYNPSGWISALNKAVRIMESRKAEMKARHEREYTGGDLYVIIDEWATIYLDKGVGKDAFRLVMKLTCEGRAEHVHVIVATQDPQAKVLPTQIRNNLGTRLCLGTADAIASRVILGQPGCELLPYPKKVGYASGYVLRDGERKFYKKLPYVQQDEIDRLVSWWINQKEEFDKFNASHGRTAPGRKRSFTDRVFDWFGIQTFPV